MGFLVRAWSRSPKAIPHDVAVFDGAQGLAKVVQDAEILVNLLPLTSETYGILNTALFNRMCRGGYLIQVGRGEHMVEADLLSALGGGQLSGAALDVFLSEPLDAQHPFWNHPAIVLTPHDASDVCLSAIADSVFATATALQAGRQPAHVVDRARGY
jgi:glyoxylate/hydroxypyruvate reductase A